MRTGVIILADRSPEQTDGQFMLMKQLGGTTVVKKLMTTLRHAEISAVTVVVGYQSDEMRRHIAHRGLTCVYNEQYETGNSLISLQLGLEQLCGQCDQVLCLPADVALFSLETVKQMLTEEGEADVWIPRWEGMEGYPILLRQSSWIPLLRASSAEELKLRMEYMDTTDRGTVLRIRNRTEYEEAQTYAKEMRDANELTFNIKLRLAKQENFFGPGVVQFLQQVEEKGSMLAACQAMNMSYSKGWKMIKNAEDEMGFQFLTSSTGGSKGGNSQLTPEGRDFVRRYQELEENVNKVAEAFFWMYFADYL